MPVEQPPCAQGLLLPVPQFVLVAIRKVGVKSLPIGRAGRVAIVPKLSER